MLKPHLCEGFIMSSADRIAATTLNVTHEHVLFVDQAGFEQAKRSVNAFRVRIVSDKVLGDISTALKGF